MKMGKPRPCSKDEKGDCIISDGTLKTMKRMKNMNAQNTRREFFRKAAQLTFLSAMVGGSAYLLVKDRVELDGCADNQFCRNCQKINTCSLDQAKKYKQDER
jgi:hypothetical protein